LQGKIHYFYPPLKLIKADKFNYTYTTIKAMSTPVFYSISDGKILLNSTNWFPVRELALHNEQNADKTIQFLTEAFEPLKKELSDFKVEYDKAEDKVKMAGKISKLKYVLSNAKAIGDYDPLFIELEKIETEIKALVDKNINEREQLLKNAETLIASDTDWKSKTEQLLNLSKDLKAMPIVPDIRVEEIKNKFEEIKDAFFAKKQSFYSDQEQILLDNLDHKLEICEKAEALATSTEWKKTTEAYNKLNEEWKSIGPIPRHRNEELWLRFNQAKDVFFNAKKENYNNIKEEQEKNLILKQALIEKAEALKDSRDWKKTADLMNDLLNEWKKTGRVAEEHNDAVWQKFNEARNVFFKAKDDYYQSIRVNLEDNYVRKMAIVNRTEELANNPVIDWDTATTEVLEMVEEWKKIGRIPKEHGDAPWERFLASKKKFFDNKDAERNKRRQEVKGVLDDKLKRNKGYYNKLKRELDLEQEVLWDFQDRLKNLPPSVRAFETKERYEGIIADAEKKVNFLKQKLKDVKSAMDTDEKEFRFLNRPHTKKPNDNNKQDAEGDNKDKPAEKVSADASNTIENTEPITTITPTEMDAATTQAKLPNTAATSTVDAAPEIETIQEANVSNTEHIEENIASTKIIFEQAAPDDAINPQA
jgi:hypothetical protein